jgi:hypothetical protein
MSPEPEPNMTCRQTAMRVLEERLVSLRDEASQLEALREALQKVELSPDAEDALVRLLILANRGG